MYHRIAVPRAGSTVLGHYVSPTVFARQVSFLKALGYEAVTLARMSAGLRGEAELPAKPVVLTFDDGYENFLTDAVPVLSAAGWPGTVFVVSDLAGRTNEWDEAKGDLTERLMSWEGIRGCLDAGMEVGGHSARHVDLRMVAGEELEAETRGCLETITTKTGFAPRFFCYPYGQTNDRAIQAVRDAGFEGACSTRKGVCSEETDRYRWRRINIRRDTSLPILMWKLWREGRRDPSG